MHAEHGDEGIIWLEGIFLVLGVFPRVYYYFYLYIYFVLGILCDACQKFDTSGRCCPRALKNAPGFLGPQEILCVALACVLRLE